MNEENKKMNFGRKVLKEVRRTPFSKLIYQSDIDLPNNQRKVTVGVTDYRFFGI